MSDKIILRKKHFIHKTYYHPEKCPVALAATNSLGIYVRAGHSHISLLKGGRSCVIGNFTPAYDIKDYHQDMARIHECMDDNFILRELDYTPIDKINNNG